MGEQAPVVPTPGFLLLVTRHMQRVYWGGRLKEGELHMDPRGQISGVESSDAQGGQKLVLGPSAASVAPDI